MSESVQALIKVCIYGGDSGIKITMPREPHKAPRLSCVTPATALRCAAEADDRIVGAKGTITGKRRMRLFVLEERSFILPPISCPPKSVSP